MVISQGGGLTANLFSHAEWQKPKDKLAAGTTNTPFQFGIAPIRDLRTPKAYAHHINWGFSTGGQRWPSDIVLYKRSVVPGFRHLIKAHTALIVIHFLIRSVGTLVWICLLLCPLMFFLVFFFNNTSSLHSSGRNPFFVVVQAASYCLCHGCFVLPRPAAPTEKQGGFIKAQARWTQQQWIKVFCMIKSLPRGGINLICERMLLRGNKVPKSSVILFVMS